MKKMKKLLLIFAIVALSCSCKKEDVKPQETKICWECITKTVRTDFYPSMHTVTSYSSPTEYCDKTTEWIIQHEGNGSSTKYNYASNGDLLQMWVYSVNCEKQ